jgi:hypothetical protein
VTVNPNVAETSPLAFIIPSVLVPVTPSVVVILALFKVARPLEESVVTDVFAPVTVNPNVAESKPATFIVPPKNEFNTTPSPPAV